MAQERYFNFDEYKKNGTPEQKKRAENWGVAIGLQAVDGLRVSDFLLELARKNIEGELPDDFAIREKADIINKLKNFE